MNHNKKFLETNYDHITITCKVIEQESPKHNNGSGKASFPLPITNYPKTITMHANGGAGRVRLAQALGSSLGFFG